MAADALHISISAETLTTIGGFEISNSIFTSLIMSTILIVFALVASSQLKYTNKPTGLQNFVEFVVEALYNLVYGITHSHKKARAFFPLIATFFLFIMLNNWLGLIPGVGTIGVIHESAEKHAGLPPVQLDTHTVAFAAEPAQNPVLGETPTGELEEAHTQADTYSEGTEATEEKHGYFIPILRAGTADLNTTIALALISVLATQFFGFHFQKFSYFGKFINFESPIMFFVGILELISEVSKIISFAFRLFGNIFAGEVLLAVIAFLAPIALPMPFYGLEIFVGFIQALVFSLLTLVFFNMATESHEAH